MKKLTLIITIGILLSCQSKDEKHGMFSDIVTTTAKDYQIECTTDSMFIMDGNRLVGKMKLEYDADPLGTMILEDNK